MERKMVATKIITCTCYNDGYIGYHNGEHPRDRFHEEIEKCVAEGWELFGPIQFITDPNKNVVAIQQIVMYE